ncbi:MAG: diaminopimelate decarboxylase [Pseudomonadota bacterium]
MTKNLPFTKQQLTDIKKTYPTPFHLYDEKGLREHARKFKKAFSVFPGFKEYFAVKATPNPIIMKILNEEGFGADCSSIAELILSEKVGIIGEDIMFTSNDTEQNEYQKARQLGAIINLDDIAHIDYLEQALNNQGGLPELICFRYNPGPEREGNAIIGDPKEAKYGFTREQLFAGYKMCMEKGVKRFGLHTMIISNELNADFFVETATMLFELAVQLKEQLGLKLEFVNLGGGIGVPYLPEEKAVDYDYVAEQVMKQYQLLIAANDLDPLKIYMECGRVISGPYGYLVTDVIHMKHTYKDYVGTNATMANLMRPALYGAYHHISAMGKEQQKNAHLYDVTGSLCENNDKFAINRELPEIVAGDILAIHDAGAHGHSMGFNYNGKLRSAELLLREDQSVVEIRRAETLDDYFATLDFEQIEKF